MTKFSDMKEKLIKMMFVAVLAGAGVADAMADDAGQVMFRNAAIDPDYVWMATADGLVRHDKKSGEEQTFSSDRYKNLTAVAVSSDGTVYVGGAAGAGTAVFDGSSFAPLAGADMQNVSRLICADRIWAGASQCLYAYDGSSWETYESAYPMASYYQFDALAFDGASGTLWFGVDTNVAGGKLGYVSQEGKLSYVADFTENVYDMCFTGEGTLLMATESGMFRCDNGVVSFLEHPISALPRKCTAVAAADNKVWFAGGNTLVSGTGNAYRSFRCDTGHESDYITTILPDGDTVWVTLAYGGLYRFDGETFEHAGVGAVVRDSEAGDGRTYDLNGIEIREPRKGAVYIRNGKKVTL